ncbi:MAG TPA: shikimate dehydrogenase [Flavobacteriaceae bacterium]|nr:shikimate dehydrogenase [Flavobacteriaceae bacterium]
MDKYGLIGKNIDYSFSKKFFSEKFQSEKIQAEYINFDIDEITDFPKILRSEKKLKGLNVTIPYKEKIIPFLSEITSEAKKIGAVNTIDFRNGKTIGYNTDAFGFVEALRPYLKKKTQKALILGSGGASKAVAFGLKSLNIPFKIVSRKPSETFISYKMLSKKIIQQHSIIINCTPLGTFPNAEQCPEIPYSLLEKNHLLFDLTYNPPLSLFLKNGLLQGAEIENGQKMLEFQAKKAWQIWNTP